MRYVKDPYAKYYIIKITGLMGDDDICQYEFQADDQLEIEEECREIFFTADRTQLGATLTVEAYDPNHMKSPVFRIQSVSIE